jgi:hypothetical protein
MKYIKRLNIDFDQWYELLNNNEYNFNLFINDKNDKYALYLNKDQYYNIFLPYIKKNNIKLFWNNSNKNILNININFNYNDIVLYKLNIINYQLTYSNLSFFNKYYSKLLLLKIK